MINVLNITSPNNNTDLYKIKFKFVPKSFKGKSDVMITQNIMTFDIETSNGYVDENGDVHSFDKERYDAEFDKPTTERAYQEFIDQKCKPVSLMYMWQICIESSDGMPYVFIGRTWEEFDLFVEVLSGEIRRQSVYGFNTFNRDNETKMALKSKKVTSAFLYIHNLGFEYQHLRNLYNADFAKKKKVFAREMRKPMKCKLTRNKVTFDIRDTLVLTQKSLKSWTKDENLPVQKLDEDKSFYEGIITPDTPLESERVRYAINDVLSMVYGIEKYRNKYGTLQDIPLTQTGTVRKICRDKLWNNDQGWCEECCNTQKDYSLDLYKNLIKVFQGGWTHANARWVGKLVRNVRCGDFASSYPAVMTTRRMPCGDFRSRGPQYWHFAKKINIHTGDERWFGKFTFTNVFSNLDNNYWSLSKCEEVDHPLVDNGRISMCDSMTIWMTDLDYDIFKRAYRFSSEECHELYTAEADYLSRELILTILEYFKYKTSLKGTGEESLYIESKQFINSIYGCAVTKLISKEITFTEDGWAANDELTLMDFVETMSKTKPKQTFIAYQHGVWVTAWARWSLWQFILKLDKKVVYCDTDSVKGVFTDKDLEFFDKWNQDIEKLQAKVAADLNFDPALYTAVTSKGKVKRLGVMEREDDCLEFKTLGAKRYVDRTADGIQCTIAGLPKSAGVAKFKEVDEFTDQTFWRTAESGKLCACYNDNQPTTRWTDAYGNTYISTDKYGLCLKPTTFDMSMADEFKAFIAALMTGEMDDENIFNDTPSILR